MFKVLTEGCTPTRATKYSACADLYAAEDVTISAGETKVIRLGVAIDEKLLKKASDKKLEQVFGQTIETIIGTIDGDEDIVYFDNFKKSHYIQLMLRSSLGAKGLILPNGVGVIDLDYHDELKMIIHNPVSRKNTMLIDYEDGTTNMRYDAEYIKKGDRIAQATLIEHKGYLFGIESDVERTGGIGSSGR